MNKRKSLNENPDWLLQAVRVMRDAERGVNIIDIELRNAMAMDAMDSRLMSEMQNVRDALGVVKVSLAVMDMVAAKLVGELAGRESSAIKQADAG